jgi:hypothetical protein
METAATVMAKFFEHWACFFVFLIHVNAGCPFNSLKTGVAYTFFMGAPHDHVGIVVATVE